MLPVTDAQVRLALLNHVVSRFAEAPAQALHAAGLEPGHVARLRRLSAVELGRLASIRDLAIGVKFDAETLNAALRAVAVASEARALEAHFVRHGASTQMMSTLFKMSRKVTLQRRRELAAWRPGGRVRLPDYATRERIFKAWLRIHDPSHRLRYYRLHQAFPHLALAVLEAVVREFEADR